MPALSAGERRETNSFGMLGLDGCHDSDVMCMEGEPIRKCAYVRCTLPGLAVLYARGASRACRSSIVSIIVFSVRLSPLFSSSES